jgi:hypothetical protein
VGLLPRIICVAKIFELPLAVDVRRAWPVATVESLELDVETGDVPGLVLDVVGHD